jgi:hypothetical protein
MFIFAIIFVHFRKTRNTVIFDTLKITVIMALKSVQNFREKFVRPHFLIEYLFMFTECIALTAGVVEDEGAKDRGRKKQTKQRLSESDETNLLQDAFSSLTVDQLSGLLKAKAGRTGRKSKADTREEEEIRKTLAKKMAGTHNQNE